MRLFHLRPHSFETKFIWNKIHLKQNSFETTFVWDNIRLRSHSFYVTLKWSWFDLLWITFYDVPSTSLRETRSLAMSRPSVSRGDSRWVANLAQLQINSPFAKLQISRKVESTSKKSDTQCIKRASLQRGVKWMWSQMNVVSNEWGLECGLKWQSLMWMWSRMNRSQMS